MLPLTDQQILAQLQELDPFSRRELLDFLEFLRYRKQPEVKPVVAAPAVKNPITAWDTLENMADSVNAPPDWAAEHDHYMYGTPKNIDYPKRTP
jgi:hypothetical protein